MVPSMAFDPPPKNTRSAVVAIEFLEQPPLTPHDQRILRLILQVIPLTVAHSRYLGTEFIRIFCSRAPLRTLFFRGPSPSFGWSNPTNVPITHRWFIAASVSSLLHHVPCFSSSMYYLVQYKNMRYGKLLPILCGVANCLSSARAAAGIYRSLSTQS